MKQMKKMMTIYLCVDSHTREFMGIEPNQLSIPKEFAPYALEYFEMIVDALKKKEAEDGKTE